MANLDPRKHSLSQESGFVRISVSGQTDTGLTVALQASENGVDWFIVHAERFPGWSPRKRDSHRKVEGSQ